MCTREFIHIPNNLYNEHISPADAQFVWRCKKACLCGCERERVEEEEEVRVEVLLAVFERLNNSLRGAILCYIYTHTHIHKMRDM